MARRSVRKQSFFLLLLILLIAPSLSEASPWLSSASGRADTFSRTFILLSKLWTGCHIDPDGRPACRSTPEADLATPACRLTPNGCQVYTLAPESGPSKEGCHIDPNGRCKP